MAEPGGHRSGAPSECYEKQPATSTSTPASSCGHAQLQFRQQGAQSQSGSKPVSSYYVDRTLVPVRRVGNVSSSTNLATGNATVPDTSGGTGNLPQHFCYYTPLSATGPIPSTSRAAASDPRAGAYGQPKGGYMYNYNVPGTLGSTYNCTTTQYGLGSGTGAHLAQKPMDCTPKARPQRQQQSQLQHPATAISTDSSSRAFYNTNHDKIGQNMSFVGTVTAAVAAKGLELLKQIESRRNANLSLEGNLTNAKAATQASSTQLQNPNMYYGGMMTSSSMIFDTNGLGQGQAPREGQAPVPAPSPAPLVFARKSAPQPPQKQPAQDTKMKNDFIGKKPVHVDNKTNSDLPATATAAVTGEIPKVAETEAAKHETPQPLQNATRATGVTWTRVEEKLALRLQRILNEARCRLAEKLEKPPSENLRAKSPTVKPKFLVGTTDAPTKTTTGSEEEQGERESEDRKADFKFEGEEQSESGGAGVGAGERRASLRARRKRQFFDPSDYVEGVVGKIEAEEELCAASRSTRTRSRGASAKGDTTKANVNREKTLNQPKNSNLTPSSADSAPAAASRREGRQENSVRCIGCGDHMRNRLKFRSCSGCDAYYHVDCVNVKDLKSSPASKAAAGKFHWQCTAKGCTTRNEDFVSVEELMQHRQKHGKANTFVRSRATSASRSGSGSQSTGSRSGPSTPKSRLETPKDEIAAAAVAPEAPTKLARKSTFSVIPIEKPAPATPAAVAPTTAATAPAVPKRRAGRPQKHGEDNGAKKARLTEVAVAGSRPRPRGRAPAAPHEGSADSDSESEPEVEPRPKRQVRGTVKYTEPSSDESSPEDYVRDSDDDEDSISDSDEEDVEEKDQKPDEEDAGAGVKSASGSVSEDSVAAAVKVDFGCESVEKDSGMNEPEDENEDGSEHKSENEHVPNQNEKVEKVALPPVVSPAAAAAAPIATAHPPANPANVAAWTVWSAEDVRAHFIAKGMEKEANLLYREEFDGLALQIVTRKDLTEMKMPWASILKIEKVLQELRLLPKAGDRGIRSGCSGVLCRCHCDCLAHAAATMMN